MITQAKLFELFDYSDGNLIWKTNKTRGVKAGDVAGSINGMGYVSIGIQGKKYLAHRLIFLYHFGKVPKFIDHIDRNPKNNKIENLREATASQNQANVSCNSRNTSGVMGVSWEKRKNKWRVQIRVNGKCHHLGHFSEIEEARNAYYSAKKQYFGEFSPN